MTKPPEKTLAGLVARVNESRAEAAGKPAKPERVFRHARRGEYLRHGVGGNGGPAINAPEPVRLRLGARKVIRLGAAMYGRRWKAEVADATGEHSRELRRWASGEAAPSPRSARWIREEAVRRRAELDAAIDALDQVYPPPPEKEA
ncbi:protein of unknown function [Methylorubrum extorquens DM4]|uniref:Uncharacterized protein n=1 Tax=Methylorubrum extorquens (strain DSM 6343 / CIP 106787 / DM4) TaxID=661410 RepID=C7CFD0_METED|nr:hypothetical protein [Methylorubrum extorquens]CAX26064.1 protein of unknown function [Methylorubrum extorquens DM4]